MQIGRTSCGIAVDMEEVLLLNRASTGSRLSIEPRFDGEQALYRTALRRGAGFLEAQSTGEKLSAEWQSAANRGAIWPNNTDVH